MVLPVVSTHSMALLPLLPLAGRRGSVLRRRCTAPAVAAGGGRLVGGARWRLRRLRTTIGGGLVPVHLWCSIAEELLEEPLLGRSGLRFGLGLPGLRLQELLGFRGSVNRVGNQPLLANPVHVGNQQVDDQTG